MKLNKSKVFLHDIDGNVAAAINICEDAYACTIEPISWMSDCTNCGGTILPAMLIDNANLWRSELFEV